MLIRPRSALGLKYVELTRGTSDRGLRGRRHDPARPGHARAGRVRRVREHVRRGHARRGAGEPRGLRRRVRRPRPEPQPGDRRVPAAAARHHPRRAEPVQRARRTCRASSARWPTPRASSRPRPRRQAQLFVNLDAHVRRAARRGAPVHPGVDLRGPRDARRRDRGLPRPAAVPGQHRGPVPRAAARRARAARRRARPRRRARDRHADAAPHAAVQPPPGVAADRARDVRRGPARAARHPPPDRHGALAQPDAAVPRADAD